MTTTRVVEPTAHPRSRAWLGWGLLAVGVAGAAVVPFLLALGCRFPGEGGAAEDPGELALVLAGLAFAVIGRTITFYRAGHRMGWLLALIGAGLPFLDALGLYAGCGLNGTLPLPGLGLAALVQQQLSSIVALLLFSLVPAWFPDGRFASPAWAGRIRGVMGITVGLTLLSGLLPGPLTNNGIMSFVVANPIGLPVPALLTLGPWLFYTIPLSAILAAALGIVAFVGRFRRATGAPRQQLKWFAAFLITVVAGHLIGFELLGGLFYPRIFEHWGYPVVIGLSFGGFPVVIGLAIFRYRLYDIDIIVRRTLVYGLFTLLLAGLYFGSVVLLQRLFTALSGQRSPLAVVLSTLFMAALFNPLRRRVQAAIDRRFYRRRYDAGRILGAFAETAHDETDLERLTGRLAAVVRQAVQPEQVAVWLRPASPGAAGG